jgi:hypothetical protein
MTLCPPGDCLPENTTPTLYLVCFKGERSKFILDYASPYMHIVSYAWSHEIFVYVTDHTLILKK